jgi:HD superfamily phosphohydrolase
MELAGRVFDVVTDRRNLHADATPLIDEYADNLAYWRKVLRIAALCHDIGHLPFSHAAEDLLPPGWSHERLTVEMLRGDEMRGLLNGMTPPVKAEEVARLAAGEKELSRLGPTSYSQWERLLAEIIGGDAFGVDRMDYLLRDSLHSGVAYGRFDHYRLIDSLRILPAPEAETEGEAEGAGKAEADRLALGVDAGGVHSAEALALARYFMFSQIYFHGVRRIYDLHLRDFLKAWLPGGRYPTEYESHLAMTDDEVGAEMRAAAQRADHPGHTHAKRIAERQHYRVLYERSADDFKKNPDALNAVFRAAAEKYGEDSVRHNEPPPNPKRAPRFPVLERDGRIAWAHDRSSVLSDNGIPKVVVGWVYVEPSIRDEARMWLDGRRSAILEPSGGGS